MADKVALVVIKGPLTGKSFVFERHDTLLLGRQGECHICLPNDKWVSRHHFLMEVNPPLARLRDLGSLNGTFVNGTRYGGRQKHETPEEGGRHRHPAIDLSHNDEVRVGETTMRFEVQAQSAPLITHCQQCGQSMVGEETGEQALCSRCRQRLQNEPVMQLFSHFAAGPAKKVGGIRLADYQVQRKLGEGGMGAVYLIAPVANAPGQQMALKVMSARTALDPLAKQAFLREIDSTRTLKHAHIVDFLGSGVAKDIFYFLLEYCQGGSIDQLMERRGGPLSLAEAGPIMLQSLKGLAFAHRRSFVHRDIKPQNILLGGTEGNWQAKIADFGLAKNFIDAGLSGMTVSGEEFAGSLLFMARDQLIDFKYTRPTSDVWSIGATFYYMLTGKVPRPNTPGRDPAEIILRDRAIPLRQADPQISPALAAIIDQALAFDPGDRYSTAAEMLDALAKVLKAR